MRGDTGREDSGQDGVLGAGHIAHLLVPVRSVQLLGAADESEPFDIVADFAGPLPTVVIAELLGVPPEDAHQFRLWTEAVTGTGTDGPRDASVIGRYNVELRRYLLEETHETVEAIRQRRVRFHEQPPGADRLTACMNTAAAPAHGPPYGDDAQTHA
jgi:cytochrome P450